MCVCSCVYICVYLHCELWWVKAWTGTQENLVCEALTAYMGQHLDEVSFSKGDHVEILLAKQDDVSILLGHDPSEQRARRKERRKASKGRQASSIKHEASSIDSHHTEIQHTKRHRTERQDTSMDKRRFMHHHHAPPSAQGLDLQEIKTSQEIKTRPPPQPRPLSMSSCPECLDTSPTEASFHELLS